MLEQFFFVKIDRACTSPRALENRPEHACWARIAGPLLIVSIQGILLIMLAVCYVVVRRDRADILHVDLDHSV